MVRFGSGQDINLEKLEEEHFLRMMEKQIKQVHHHRDGSPVRLHVEDHPKEDITAKTIERPVNISYGTEEKPAHFGCQCGKKWEALFRGDKIEVNEMPAGIDPKKYGGSASHGGSYGSSSSGGHGGVYGSSSNNSSKTSYGNNVNY